MSHLTGLIEQKKHTQTKNVKNNQAKEKRKKNEFLPSEWSSICSVSSSKSKRGPTFTAEAPKKQDRKM